MHCSADEVSGETGTCDRRLCRSNWHFFVVPLLPPPAVASRGPALLLPLQTPLLFETAFHALASLHKLSAQLPSSSTRRRRPLCRHIFSRAGESRAALLEVLKFPFIQALTPHVLLLPCQEAHQALQVFRLLVVHCQYPFPL